MNPTSQLNFEPQELTVEAVEKHFERWRNAITPVGKTKRKLAESAIHRLYNRTGMERPAVFWCQSFYQMMTLPSIVIGILHSDMWELIAGASTASVGVRQWDKYWDKTWPEIWTNAGMPLLTGMNRTSNLAATYGNLEGALISQAKREIGKALREKSLEYVQSKMDREMYRRFWAPLQPKDNVAALHWPHAKHDAYAELVYIRNREFDLPIWPILAELDQSVESFGAGISQLFGLLARLLGAEPSHQQSFILQVPAQVPWLATAELLLKHWPEQTARIKDDVQIWLDLADSCSSVMCLDGIAFVCEKATAFEVTERRRLHHDRGPALTFADGFAQYSWQGVIVPAFVVEQPESITVEDIEKENNAEVRRVMIERYGMVRYLQDAQVQPIHQDDFGTLYRKELRGDEPLVIVKVVNASPEPDGTFKDYFLRVPPNMETAKAAVAWTFGFDSEEDYDPAVQT